MRYFTFLLSRLNICRPYNAARPRRKMITVRKYKPADWDAVWEVIRPVLRRGETYPLNPDIGEREARGVWVHTPRRLAGATYVAEDENGRIVGSFYIKRNQPCLGAHVCNCGYITAESARGMGVGSLLCEYSQQAAAAMGFTAMQFNLVVATNDGAFRLWKKHGFTVVGALQQAFRHPKHGLVDAYVMYKLLAG